VWTDVSLKLSVCIPTYNRPDQIEALLTNLAGQRDLPDEVVIVDASSDEQTATVIERHRAAFTGIVYERSPKGLTLQRNRAIDLATGDILLFLDDDILLEPDFITEVKGVFAQDTAGRIGGITGVQTNLRAAIFGGGWRLKEVLGIIETREPGRLLGCGETTPLPRGPFEGVRMVKLLPGGMTAWRREVFDNFRYSLFFSGYGLGEDKYFSSCLGKRYNLVICGRAKAQHLHVAGNRPNFFRWGYFNVYNHAFILHECVDRPYKRLKFFAFHSIDAVNELLTWPFRAHRKRHLLYGLGRVTGLLRSLIAPPRMAADDPAQRNRKSLSQSSGVS